MKAILNSLLFAAALTLAWGCSSDNDEVEKPESNNEVAEEPGGEVTSDVSHFNVSEAPAWAVEMHSDQDKPQFQPPEPARYENKMIVMLRLQEELVPFSTDDDQMAVFVGGECRALSSRSGEGEVIYFVLNIYGNISGDPEEFALCYYSGGLRQEFWRRGENGFLNELNIGTESDFVIDLMEGTTKYARQTVVTVTPNPTDGTAVDIANDRVGVFVGDECRGVGRPGIAFNVFHQQEGEQAQVRYYSKSKGGIYTLRTPLTLSAGVETIKFDL